MLKRTIPYLLLFIPVFVYGAVVYIQNSGDWNDPGIWLNGNIADDLSEDANISNNVGIVAVTNGNSFVIGDLGLGNGNTLSILDGGSLVVGSSTESHSVTPGNAGSIIVGGYFEVWGSINYANDLIIDITGNTIIHGDLLLNNGTYLDIQGALIVEGDLIGGNNGTINVDGNFELGGDVNVGNTNFTGTGTFDFTGTCTGPSSFCNSGPLGPEFVNCPMDIVVNVEDDDCYAEVEWVPPVFANSVVGNTFTSTHDPEDKFIIGTTSVIYKATNSAGVEAFCTFNVTVVDDSPPTFISTSLPTDIIINTTGSCTEVVNWTEPIASDPCGAILSGSHNPGETFPVGTTTVTYTATDTYENVETFSFEIIVEDNAPPVISETPTEVTAYISEGNCEESVSWPLPTVSDECSFTLTSTHSPGDSFQVGTTIVTYTATDNEGNTSSYSFNVMVIDNIAPFIDGIPSNITQILSGLGCEESISWAEPTTSGDCSITFTSSHNPGDMFGVGTTMVTYTAIDAAGNVTSSSFDVTIEDNTTPVITGTPGNITQSLSGSGCEESLSWTIPTVTDECTATLTSTHNPGDLFGIGTTIVTFTATDAAGNTTTSSFDITIEDTTSPVITGTPLNITLSLTGNGCEEVVNWIAPTASDECSATVTSTHSSGDLFPIGTTTVTYTAIDGAGNTSTSSFDVIIEDTTAPIISGIPSNITLSLTGSGCEEVVNWTAPTVSDECSATITSTHSSGDLFPIGTTTVTYTAIDGAGNTSISSFDVFIEDTTAPIISGIPSNITLSLTGSGCEEVVNWTAPTVSDECSATITSTYSPGDLFAIGTATVTYTAKDAAGNTTTSSFDITIEDTTSPVITGTPSNITQSLSGPGCEESITWVVPTATDACAVTLSSTHNPGDVFEAGATAVIYTAIDLAGNTTTSSFDVTIIDEVAPVASSCNPVITISDYDLQTNTAIAIWQEPTFTDNCEIAEVLSTHASGSSFNEGTTIVTYTAVDASGNATDCYFEVNVEVSLSPEVELIELTAESGEDIQVCLVAVSPVGNDLVIQSVNYTAPNGMVYDIDAGGLCFTYESNRLFEGEETFTVTVCDAQNPGICVEALIRIQVFLDYDITAGKVITPNGDGYNDFWKIENIDLYPYNRVVIQDRWGGVVYEAKGYNNQSIVWVPRNLPSGTYYYTINFGEGSSSISGFLELVIR